MKITRAIDISIAQPKDDEAIGRFFSQVPMDGAVRLSFERRPSFLEAAQYGHHFSQVVVGKDHSTGEILGMASRAVRARFVNGEAVDIGYLGSLRLHESRRGNIFLARGYQFLQQLHADGKVKAYISTVMEDNHQALAILTSRRAGLPTYQDLGCFLTCVLGTHSSQMHKGNGFRVEPAAEHDRPMVVAFLNHCGAKRQFYPVAGLDAREWNMEDMVLVFRGNVLAGCAALDDAGKGKQIAIHGYSTGFRMVRSLWNRFMGPWGWPTWPEAGTDLSFSFVSQMAMDTADPAVLSMLIGELQRKAHAKGLAYLLLGFHEQDPLWLLFKSRYRFVQMKSRLFLVYWEDGKSLAKQLDARPPYVELSTL
ncbi:MAG: hypothetical protein V2A70_01080 [Candidatus Omnitrophota bacterium]